MTVFRFRMSDIQPLIDHTFAAPAQRPGWSHLSDQSVLKDGITVEMALATLDPSASVDPAKIKPALIFVHDSGYYLMSNGDPWQADATGTSAIVARPTNHSTYYGSGVGDDFSEIIDAQLIRDWMAQGATEFTINMTANSILLGAMVPKGSPPPVRSAAEKAQVDAEEFFRQTAPDARKHRAGRGFTLPGDTKRKYVLRYLPDAKCYDLSCDGEKVASGYRREIIAGFATHLLKLTA